MSGATVCVGTRKGNTKTDPGAFECLHFPRGKTPPGTFWEDNFQLRRTFVIYSLISLLFLNFRSLIRTSC